MNKVMLSLSIVGCAFLALAAAPGGTASIGQIKKVSGQVSLSRNNNPVPARAGDLVEEADIITTGIDGSVGITLIDNARLSAGPNSRIELKQFRFNPTTQTGESLTEIRRGTLAIISGQIAKHSPDAMKVQTPASMLGVRGTTFAVKVED
jgi:hypothetical protein